MHDDRGIPVRERVEWISFEARMLRRRFARCLLRADLALEDGFCDDARSAIEEARAIFPSSSELAAFEARLAELEARAAAPQPGPPEPESRPAVAPLDVPLSPVPAELPREPRRVWRRLGVAAALILACLGTVAAWQIGSTWPSLVPATQTRGTADPAPPPVPPASPAAPKRPGPRNLEIVRDTIVVPAPPRTPNDLSAPGAFISARGPEAAPAPESQAETPLSAAPNSEAPIPAPEPRNDRSDVVAALNVRVPEPGPLPERLPRESIEPAPGLTAPAPPDPPAASPVDAPGARTENGTPTMARAEDLAFVRRLLERYEGAYSALDADAASEIWPSVNRSALARAFQGLAAQHVSLGTCDVTLKGPAARATCLGTASWKPKVGGGLRTEERRWEFELRKDDTGWIIERASAR